MTSHLLPFCLKLLEESCLASPRIARVTPSKELGTISKNTWDYLGYKTYMRDSLSYLHINACSFPIGISDYSYNNLIWG